ncbi:hypothetical protein [Sinorhizobium saheli]|uniref:hypothetical protein n=1 Tax=Sinorhizobium saheli TaxID=36856 RepID=UPI000A058655|nr:hypothetical protein [Sinorhizobium saheli]MQW90713.1 hypothetical protein [Sinorhizobium saheli]
MTDDVMNLRALVENSSSDDLLREMIGFAAERLMELEVGVDAADNFCSQMGFQLGEGNFDCWCGWLPLPHRIAP